MFVSFHVVCIYSETKCGKKQTMEMIKFTDGTKLFRAVKTKGCGAELQKTLTRESG